MKFNDIDFFALVEQAKNGSEKANNDLYRALKPIVFSAVGSYMRGRRSFGISDTEDLSQEIMICIFKGIKGLKEITFFKAWMNRIIQNKIFDYLRVVQSRESKLTITDNVDHEGKDLIDNTLDPLQVSLEDQIQDNHDKEILVNHLCILCRKIPSQFLMAMKEITILKKSYEKVSVEKNLSIGTIKSRVVRGREKLTSLYLESGLNLI